MIGTLQQAMDDMHRGVYDMTKNGKCTGCGNCCARFIPISDREIRVIRQYIKKHYIKEQKHTYPAPLAHPPSFDLICPFMDDSKKKDKCAIYEVRPVICRCFICNNPDGAREQPELWAERLNIADLKETFFGKGRQA